MKITRLENCDVFPVRLDGAAGASRQVPIGRADGAPNFSIRVFTLQAGGHTPYHSHESEHLNYILEGRGEVME
ncbi:MAG: cupin domain-containing protein, partial [Desulfuromonadaceae bacterium]